MFDLHIHRAARGVELGSLCKINCTNNIVRKFMLIIQKTLSTIISNQISTSIGDK
jgi:hypothetical protein